MGDTIAVQEIWRDRVWAARPMRVVHDSSDVLALWYPRTTRWRAPTSPADAPVAATRGERLARCLRDNRWDVVEYAWDVDTVCLFTPGDWHAVWVSWLPNGEQWGWYVNLQEPYVRTSCGIATFDLALDVLVDVDGTWRWKDEDELEAYVEHGVVDPALAERLYAEGRAVAERHARGAWPFDSAWPSWRPEPSWPLPSLADGWDQPCR